MSEEDYKIEGKLNCRGCGRFRSQHVRFVE